MTARTGAAPADASGESAARRSGREQRNETGEGNEPMRVMVIVKATRESEAGEMPTEELLAAMGKYNEELVEAGVMLAGEGLRSLVGRR